MVTVARAQRTSAWTQPSQAHVWRWMPIQKPKASTRHFWRCRYPSTKSIGATCLDSGGLRGLMNCGSRDQTGALLARRRYSKTAWL